MGQIHGFKQALPSVAVMYTQVPACLIITCGCGHAHSQTRGWKVHGFLLEGATFFNWKVKYE